MSDNADAIDRVRSKDTYQPPKSGQGTAGGRGRGRPKGSATGNAEVVETVPAACPHCGATRRKSLRIIKEMEFGGASPGGHPRTHIVWRRCQCDACAGYFVEMAHENRG